MAESLCDHCPIKLTCPQHGAPVGYAELVDSNDCMYWSCPSVGKPAAQRALRSTFKSPFKVKIGNKLVELVRFGSIQKPTANAFSEVQRAVDSNGNIYVSPMGGTFKPNGQNAFDIKGK